MTGAALGRSFPQASIEATRRLNGNNLLLSGALSYPRSRKNSNLGGFYAMTRKQMLVKERADLVREDQEILAKIQDEKAWAALEEDERAKFTVRHQEIVAKAGEIDGYLEMINQGDGLKERQDSFADQIPASAANGPTPPKPDAKKEASNFWESLQKQAMESYTTTHQDFELRVPDPVVGYVAAASGLSEGVLSDGGFLVGKDAPSGIIQRVYTQGQVISRCMRFAISANSNGIKLNAINETSRADGSRMGGIRGYWADEAAEKTSSKPAFRKMELELHKLVGLVYATDELLADTTALQTWIMANLPGELMFRAEDAIINGTGAGQPLGIMNAGAKIAVPKETGQPAATIVYENIVNMQARLWAGSRPNSVWFYDQSIEPQLHTMSLSVGTGGVPVYMPANGAASSPFGTLYGRPAIPIEYGQALGTEGDIILADMSQYVIADKGGVQSASSMHVRFIYDEMTFRFVYRVDGQPIWNSALTPNSGGSTQSPFITLATRS
jgi:HK97 family phage major capsid protein